MTSTPRAGVSSSLSRCLTRPRTSRVYLAFALGFPAGLAALELAVQRMGWL